jgi:hypothetical protein
LQVAAGAPRAHTAGDGTAALASRATSLAQFAIATKRGRPRLPTPATRLAARYVRRLSGNIARSAVWGRGPRTGGLFVNLGQNLAGSRSWFSQEDERALGHASVLQRQIGTHHRRVPAEPLFVRAAGFTNVHF